MFKTIILISFLVGSIYSQCANPDVFQKLDVTKVI